MIGSRGARFDPALAAASDLTRAPAGRVGPTIPQGCIQTIVDARRSMRQSSANEGGCDQLAQVFNGDIADSHSLTGAPQTKGAALEPRDPRADAFISGDPGFVVDEMALISQSNLNRVRLRRKYWLKTRH